ncbi:hypothetical protein D3C86_1826070 [compost metagenome]
MHGVFFTVGEPRHLLAFDQRLAVRGFGMPKNTGRMANGRDRLAGVVERLDQGNRVFVFGQVPQRAMAAGIENRIVVTGFYRAEHLR